jgi:hypothetical protein
MSTSKGVEKRKAKRTRNRAAKAESPEAKRKHAAALERAKLLQSSK